VRVPALRRILRILGALAAGHFVAANILLAGKVLSDVTNLYHYSSWAYWGGPVFGYIVTVVFATTKSFLLSLVPAAIILSLTEALKIRGWWFYMTMAGLGSALLDLACTRIAGLVSARSFCVTLSASEVTIVTVAGVAAGFTYWRIAGWCSGELSARAVTAPMTPV
jgi:hypothetical protein